MEELDLDLAGGVSGWDVEDLIIWVNGLRFGWMELSEVEIDIWW